MSSGGGGGGAQQVTSTNTTSNLPPYVQPYFEQILQRGLFESSRPYTPYGGQRMAQFAPEETAAQRGIAGLQRPEQLGMASDIAAQVGYGQMPSGMNIANQFQPDAISPDYRATQFQSGYGPGQFGANYQAGQVGPGYQAGVLQPQFQSTQFTPGYQAGTFTPGYQAGQLQAGFEAGSMAAPGSLASYMSPYQQAVTDVQSREAVRASEAQRPQVSAGAARAGALGGTRATLLEAERQRNLGQQLGDIQARGSQAGFEQARAGFEADRSARLQQAQFGLGSFQAQEAARQRGGEMGLQAQQAGEQARQRAAEMGMSAQQQAEASRQATEQFRQSAFQQTEAGRQAQGQQGLAAFQAQEAARQQQGQFQLQAQQAGEQARQEAARMGLSAQQQTDASRRAEQEFRTQSQQFNIEQQRQRALLGLEGLSSDRAGQAQRLSVADLLSGFGGRQQEMDLQRLAALGGVGAERRGLMQRGLDTGYEDFLRQQAYGREQLGYLSNLLQGIPVTPGSTVSTFGRVPSPEQQALGAGLGALGLYQSLGGRGRGP